jgi:hypothetical protein
MVSFAEYFFHGLHGDSEPGKGILNFAWLDHVSVSVSFKITHLHYFGSGSSTPVLSTGTGP